jgi:hypothetical protein
MIAIMSEIHIKDAPVDENGNEILKTKGGGRDDDEQDISNLISTVVEIYWAG